MGRGSKSPGEYKQYQNTHKSRPSTGTDSLGLPPTLVALCKGESSGRTQNISLHLHKWQGWDQNSRSSHSAPCVFVCAGPCGLTDRWSRVSADLIAEEMERWTLADRLNLELGLE